MSNNSEYINTVEQLRAIIPPPLAIMTKRIKFELDHYCIDIIQSSTMVALGRFTDKANFLLLDINHEPVKIIDSKTLLLKVDRSQSTKKIVSNKLSGNDVSLYFIMPGIGYGLRVNGQIQSNVSDKSVSDQSIFNNFDELIIEIETVYVHCSRAKVRADFWMGDETVSLPEFQAPSAEQGSRELSSLLKDYTYGLLLTENENNATEISPRGGPRGFLKLQSDSTLLIPEMPGNKVAVSMINIIKTGKIGLLLINPGSENVLILTGRANITADPTVLKRLEAKSKVPKLAIVINIDDFELTKHESLISSKLWDVDSHVDAKSLPSFSKVLAEHMSGIGFKGKATEAVVNYVVKKDLKNLY